MDLDRGRGGERHGHVLGMKMESYQQSIRSQSGVERGAPMTVTPLKGSVTKELRDKLWNLTAWVQILALPLINM